MSIKTKSQADRGKSNGKKYKKPRDVINSKKNNLANLYN